MSSRREFLASGMRSSFVSLCNQAVRCCFFDEVVGYDIPLLAKEGWREAPGWSLTPKRFEMRFVTWCMSDHPVSAPSEASRHFLSDRATPPSQGGECAPPEKLWLRPQAVLCLCGFIAYPETPCLFRRGLLNWRRKWRRIDIAAGSVGPDGAGTESKMILVD